MKIQEIRIGSFVFQFGEVTRIVQLDVGGKTYHRINDMQVHKSSFLTGGKICFEPIILTGDWLLKFGFERIFMHTFQIKYNFIRDERILTIEGEGGYVAFIGKKTNIISISTIQYVHQLQNLYFVLTGDELEYQPS